MRYLNLDILREEQTPNNFPVFFRVVRGATDCNIHRRVIKSIDMDGRDFFRKGNSIRALFLKLFAATAYELEGYDREAAVCYDYAAKSADALEFRMERGEMLKCCAYRYLAVCPPDFLNAGFAFLKASTCEEERLKIFRDLKRAEHSFACAGRDIERDSSVANLYQQILQEIKAPTLNEEFLGDVRKSLECENLEVLISEVLFARKSELGRCRIDQLREKSKKTKNRPPSYGNILISALAGRGYELLPPSEIKNFFAAEAYEQAAACAGELNLMYHCVDLSVRAARNFRTAGKKGKAAQALRQASQYSRPVFREGLAKMADSLRQPKPL